MDKYGPKGEGAFGEWKRMVSSGEYDHLIGEAEEISTQKEAARAAEEKSRKDERNRAWREKNVPILAKQKAEREKAEREKAIAEEKDRQRKAEERVARAKAASEASQSANKTYLDVPYHDKDFAKRNGAFWDPGTKKWYVPGNVPDSLSRYRREDSARSAQGGESSIKKVLPTSGRISTSDPSIYGHELLGYEGESWKSFLESPDGRAMKSRLGMDSIGSFDYGDEEGWDSPDNYDH